MRPTSRRSSVDKVDVDLDTVASGGGAHDSADALRGATTAADHPAEIARADFHLELQPVAVLDGVDLHGISIVDDRSHDMRQHGCCGRRGELVRRLYCLGGLYGFGGLYCLVRPVGDGLVSHGLVGHLVARAALNSAIAPDTSSNFLTRSVGCAPCINHFTALALSMLSVDGSVRGLYVPTIWMKRPSRGERLSVATTR